MICQPIKYYQRAIIAVCSILLIVLFYTYLSRRQHQINPDDTTIPTWAQLAKGVQQVVTPNYRSGERWLIVDLKATGTRLAIGLGISIIGAIIIGLLMGCIAHVESFFIPIFCLCSIPPTAVLAVFFVLVDTDIKLYVLMIAFGILPSMTTNICSAIKEIPAEFIYKSYTLGGSHMEAIWNIVFRYVLPNIINSVKTQMGPALIYLIAAEMLCSNNGIGFRVRLESHKTRMDIVYPYLIMLASFSLTVDYFLKKLRDLLCPRYIKK